MSTIPQDDNPYASPQSEEALVVSNPTPAWRDGELLVVEGDGELPRRCLKCGASEVNGRSQIRHLQVLTQPSGFVVPQMQQLVVLVPALLAVTVASSFLIVGLRSIRGQASPGFAFAPILSIVVGIGLFGLFLFLLSRAPAWLQSKHSRVMIGVFRCDRHRRQLFKLRALNYSILVCGIGMSGLLLASPELIRFRIIPILLGLMFANTLVYDYLSGKLRIVRHANGHTWLSGFGKPFVDSLPLYPHGGERGSPAISALSPDRASSLK